MIFFLKYTPLGHKLVFGRGGCLRVFETKWFARFARKEKIKATQLRDAIVRAEQGGVDAELGGGLIKQRVAR
jgi:hypothetical protein